MQTETAYLNYETPIAIWNQENPELKQIDLKSLADKCNCGNQSLVNYKHGRTPDIFLTLWKFCKKYNVRFSEIVIFKDDDIYFKLSKVADKIPGKNEDEKVKLLSKELGIRDQRFYHWIIGEMPRNLLTIKVFSELSGKPFEELLIVKKS